MIRALQTIPIPLLLLLATTLEVSGDAVVRLSIFQHAGLIRIALFLGGGVLLLGYGSPTKAGLGVAANVGLDLRAGDSGLVQYGALQGSYNWDCCGFSVDVRKYELGAVRNETSERFNFTLLNIGTAGNLRRAASLF